MHCFSEQDLPKRGRYSCNENEGSKCSAMEEELNKKTDELEAKTSLSLEQEKQISELTQEVQAVQKMAEEMEEEMRKKVEDSEKAKEQAEKTDVR